MHPSLTVSTGGTGGGNVNEKVASAGVPDSNSSADERQTSDGMN